LQPCRAFEAHCRQCHWKSRKRSYWSQSAMTTVGNRTIGGAIFEVGELARLGEGFNLKRFFWTSSRPSWRSSLRPSLRPNLRPSLRSFPKSVCLSDWNKMGAIRWVCLSLYYKTFFLVIWRVLVVNYRFSFISAAAEAAVITGADMEALAEAKLTFWAVALGGAFSALKNIIQ